MSYSEHQRPLFTAEMPHIFYMRCKICGHEMKYFNAIKVKHGKQYRTYFDFYHCVNPACPVGKKIRKNWKKAR